MPRNRTMLALVACAALASCKTTDESGAETKDSALGNGQVTKHYYAVGEEARRALCPFGVDAEDAESYRAQCTVTKKLALDKLAGELEDAYQERFKNGDDLSEAEVRSGGLLVESLLDPGVLKAKASQVEGSDLALSRFALLLDEAFGFESEDAAAAESGGSDAPGDSGSLVLTTSVVAPLGVSTTPLIVAQSALTTDAVSVQLAGCAGQVVGLGVAEGLGQAVLGLQNTGDGKFQTRNGKSRRFALLQPTIDSSGGFCQIKITSAGSAPRGGGEAERPGELGPEVLIGNLSYNGGFIPQLVQALDPPRFVRQFRVALPDGCKAEVVKGGVLTTQQVAPTKLLDGETHSFQVNGGAGTLASGVSVSLNGPLGFCQIPVFVR